MTRLSLFRKADEFIFSKSINFIYRFNTIKEKNYMSMLIDENIDKI